MAYRLSSKVVSISMFGSAVQIAQMNHCPFQEINVASENSSPSSTVSLPSMVTLIESFGLGAY